MRCLEKVAILFICTAEPAANLFIWHKATIDGRFILGGVRVVIR
jgi:hypothetical protein